jgi:ATP-dependent Clp protease ATP-binding subunit ClpX
MTPSQIVNYLDQHVVGQEDAKRQLAVAIYTHYKKIALAAPDKVEIIKSNVLLIGPTGTGKTLVCETLARVLQVPFVTANATSLAQSEYVNDEIEAILQRLIDKAEGDIGRAQRGIVFIDEIDTTQVLFICGGAFVGLDANRARTRAFGFISTSEGDNQKMLDRLNARVKPPDLFEFGLIQEFAGRLPIIANFNPRSREMMVRIMTEPTHSIYKQYRQMLAIDGVDLQIDALVFEQIADLAMEYRVGARSLRGIFEEMLTPAMYLLPDHPEVRQVRFASLFEDPKFIGARAAGPS